MVLIDSYTDMSDAWILEAQHPSSTSDESAMGQSFKPSINAKITKVTFRLRRSADAEGTLEARLYASTGTHGVDAKPKGEPLAVSDPVDINQLSTSWGDIDFVFSDNQKYPLTKNTVYCIELINKVLISGSIHFSAMGINPTHDGNLSGFLESHWGSSDLYDATFWVYGNPEPKIELDVGDPPRTIYEDIVNLPDPVKLGITVRAFNHDDVGLYFQVTAECSGWTFETENLGLVGSGADIHQNLDEFGSRAKPASETEQIIKLILKAYTDAGYTDLKWTYERNVTIVFIKSDDASYTVDELDNFDDGTVQGWAVADELNNKATYPQIGVVTDYVLSAPYSCKMTQGYSGVGSVMKEVRARLYKSFITPNKETIYAILDVRQSADDPILSILKYLKVARDAVDLIFLGRPFDTVETEDFPRDKWARIVVPLPKNTTLEVRIIQSWLCIQNSPYAYLWLDDFKIISK